MANITLTDDGRLTVTGVTLMPGAKIEMGHDEIIRIVGVTLPAEKDDTHGDH